MPDRTPPSNHGTQHLQKCVDVLNIRDWVPEPARRRIAIIEAHNIIKEHYCGALVSRGVCPIECIVCKPELIDLFRLEGAKKPAALLTWLAKDHSARLIEKLIEIQKAGERGSFDPMFPALETAQQQYDALFTENEKGNLFVELMKDYDE